MVGLAVDLYPEKQSVYPGINTYKFADRSAAGIRLQGNTFDPKQHFSGAIERMQALIEDPVAWRELMATNLAAANQHAAVASGKAGAIGYCLGGQSCLEQLRAGHAVQAIVSFHGLLNSRPMTKRAPFDPHTRITQSEYEQRFQLINTYATGCRVLIENGCYDDHVPAESIAEWVAEMDSASIDWRFTNHARTPHGFALAPGMIASEYVEAADRRSTLAMLALFAEVWPEHAQRPVEFNACGTRLQGPLTSAPLPPKEAQPPQETQDGALQPFAVCCALAAGVVAAVAAMRGR